MYTKLKVVMGKENATTNYTRDCITFETIDTHSHSTKSQSDTKPRLRKHHTTNCLVVRPPNIINYIYYKFGMVSKYKLKRVPWAISVVSPGIQKKGGNTQNAQALTKVERSPY